MIEQQAFIFDKYHNVEGLKLLERANIEIVHIEIND